MKCPVCTETDLVMTERQDVDSDGRALTIEYDPSVISDDSVREIAAQLAPEVQHRLDKCLMRLRGRACEACALSDGVRRVSSQG